ncbi:HDOD domain-containing protein [Exilibacterium tricleocarpae]|uniref:HDOD domain-containing protein n=1 Tax=Exilibacterium tricleocarpae TaxID=2591008 RepID=A0A545SNF9_9GAMM|nr:HDOD domain-containing protein [Exilibacterium tricleocarpae]
MPVPESVKELLSTRNVAYSLSPAPRDGGTERVWHQHHLRSLGAAKSQILQDEQGQVLVLIPADCLLDLNVVNRRLGRDLRAIPTGQLRRFIDEHQLESVPAVPNMAGLPTLVDRRLLKRDDLLLDSGFGDQLLRLKQADFQQILSDVNVSDITVPLAQLETDTSGLDDHTQVQNAVHKFTGMRIKQRLEETLELPPLPKSANRIIKLRVDRNADVSDLAEIVEMDPSLAAQVISWASSPYYSTPGKIKSLHDAIVRVLGFDMVLNLSLGLAMGKTLKLPEDLPQGTTPYWQMAVYTATTVEGLVGAIPRAHRPSFGLAYLSGLLSNFGYLVLAEVFPPYFNVINRYTEANPHVQHEMIDRHILGITREQLASCLTELWSVPPEIVTALRHQNTPEYDGDHHEYAKLVHVAQLLLSQRGFGSGPSTEVPVHLYEQLNLQPDAAAAVLDDVMKSLDELDGIARQLGG